MASGDERALIELHRRYAPCLTATVRRLLASEDDVHKTVEDAFVSAWRKADCFNAERVTLRAWLVMLTLRLVLNRSCTEYLTVEDLKSAWKGAAAGQP